MKRLIVFACVLIIAVTIGGVVAFTYNSTSYLSGQANVIGALQTEEEQRPLSLLAVGDVMVGRYVEGLMISYGSDYPFENISTTLKSVDAVIANLEGPVMDEHVTTPSGSVKFSFASHVPGVLYHQNIKIVSIANNHTYDFGVSAYNQTVKHLTNSNINHAGHPYKFGQEYVLYKTIKNKKFIFIGFNITNPNFEYEAAHEFVKNVKKDGDEFIVAMVHGGDEYELTSNATQKTFYRGLIDDGVDLVIGHHPHVVQEIEVYKDKAIFYSLGNFIFDQYFSNDVQRLLGVKITFPSKDKVQYELVPMRSIRSQPRLMDDPELTQWLDDLANRSSPIIKDGVRGLVFGLPTN